MGLLPRGGCTIVHDYLIRDSPRRPWVLVDPYQTPSSASPDSERMAKPSEPDEADHEYFLVGNGQESRQGRSLIGFAGLYHEKGYAISVGSRVVPSHRALGLSNLCISVHQQRGDKS